MSLQRLAISDRLDGRLVLLDGIPLLTTQPDPPGEVLAAGPLLLRYGLVCLETPQHCLVPELMVMEYGEQLNGEAAWDFLLRHSNLHPRAEVFGRRDDGCEDQLRVSRLDLAQAPRVLVWPQAAADALQPLARVTDIVCSEPDSLPDRPRQYLSLHATFADWQDDRH